MAVEAVQILEMISSLEMQAAWDWFLGRVQPRPANQGAECYFDNKHLSDDPTIADFEEAYEWGCILLARLYLASQFGEHSDLMRMVHGKPAPPVNRLAGNLDRDIETVVISKTRFRNSFSEHLSFWIRLAVERKQRGDAYLPDEMEFSHSRPNIQPEDKGPDGLYVEVAPQYRLEVQSVKNSIANPRRLIASPAFRGGGIATKGSQLDDFWLFRHQNNGLIRLEDILERTLASLDMNTTKQLRLGLVKSGAYNAVVVANAGYAHEDLFRGYLHVVPDISKRIATYLGAEDWRRLALDVNRHVAALLQI